MARGIAFHPAKSIVIVSWGIEHNVHIKRIYDPSWVWNTVPPEWQASVLHDSMYIKPVAFFGLTQKSKKENRTIQFRTVCFMVLLIY